MKYQVETRAVIQYIFAMNTVQHIGLDVGLSAEVLENIVDAVRAQARVKRIILYGSRTRADYAPTSDIDIAVELDPFTHMLLKSEIDEQIRTLLRVDIVDLSKVPLHLKNEILTTGVTLYESGLTKSRMTLSGRCTRLNAQSARRNRNSNLTV